MSPNLSRQLRFLKEPARGKGGAVAAKNQAAADVGARVLSQGGNAIDAAIATGCALAVLEPWTSGLGSVGCMTVWDARKRRGTVIDFPGVVARQIHNSELAWPGSGVVPHDSDAALRIEAYRSIAVPAGNPRGIRLRSGDELYLGRACLRFTTES